jgi:hypothetical protein
LRCIAVSRCRVGAVKINKPLPSNAVLGGECGGVFDTGSDHRPNSGFPFGQVAQCGGRSGQIARLRQRATDRLAIGDRARRRRCGRRDNLGLDGRQGVGVEGRRVKAGGHRCGLRHARARSAEALIAVSPADCPSGR